MNTQDLMSFLDHQDNGNYVVRGDRMLTMSDPSGRTDQQHPIEMVAFVDEYVVIDLLNIEDATWYDAASFDEDISTWVKCN
jgi:hypothetical protein